MKQHRYMSEFHSFISDVNDFFAESDNCFHILEKYFLSFVWYSQWNICRHDILLKIICIINIFSITFLSLQNQQDNKASSISKLKCYKSCSIWQLPRNKYLSVSSYQCDITEYRVEKICTVTHHLIFPIETQ